MNNETAVQADPTPDQGHPRRWSILAILCGSLVLVVVSVSSLNVAIPPIQRSLGASGSELQWIIDAYALVFAGLLLPAGALGDRYGRREALIAGLVVFAVASLGGMVADTPTQLILWRGVMGAGAALIMPSTLSIVATVFSPAEQPRAIAIWAGFAGAGGVIGLVSSGLLLRSWWWGSVFAINLPIVALMLVAVILVVPTSKDPDGTRLDPVGAVLSIIALGAFVFGVIEGPEKGWTSPITVTAFVVAAVGLALFVRWELRSPHPMLDPRYFLDRRF
ncbi:MAG: MFS transporter, partial [Actinomycetota bacterium]